MPAGTILPGRARSRRVRFRPWVIPAVLISLTATLAALARQDPVIPGVIIRNYRMAKLRW
jgi:hypothetical protein